MSIGAWDSHPWKLLSRHNVWACSVSLSLCARCAWIEFFRRCFCLLKFASVAFSLRRIYSELTNRSSLSFDVWEWENLHFSSVHGQWVSKVPNVWWQCHIKEMLQISAATKIWTRSKHVEECTMFPVWIPLRARVTHILKNKIFSSRFHKMICFCFVYSWMTTNNTSFFFLCWTVN